MAWGINTADDYDPFDPKIRATSRMLDLMGSPSQMGAWEQARQYLVSQGVKNPTTRQIWNAPQHKAWVDSQNIGMINEGMPGMVGRYRPSRQAITASIAQNMENRIDARNEVREQDALDRSWATIEATKEAQNRKMIDDYRNPSKLKPSDFRSLYNEVVNKYFR